jgi:small subunit ribosomal protein S20
MSKEEAPKKKTKTPTAEKRMIQNKKTQTRNRAAKSKIKTVSKKFAESLVTKDRINAAENLKSVYSLVDKAVKSKIYTANKAKRLKSHFAKNFNKELAV